jgi:hypothetical protein
MCQLPDDECYGQDPYHDRPAVGPETCAFCGYPGLYGGPGGRLETALGREHRCAVFEAPLEQVGLCPDGSPIVRIRES